MSRRTRRAFLKALAGAGALAPSLGLVPGCRRAGWGRAGTKRPPNVVLIMTDDQGWGDVHSHGNDKIDTPVLDALAAEGVRFETFFVSPLCAPTRASLLTGRYHLRTGTHGVTRGYETMRSGEVTIAEAFKQAGYVTGCFGKWHNGRHWPYHPNGQGFDEFLGFCAGHWNNYFDTELDHNGRMVKTRGYISDVLTDAAIEFIRTNRRRPFFCYVPYNAPHSPFQVPDRYFDKYKARGLDDRLACIYGMCENLDDNIGRLLRQLDRLNLAEQTIVVFLPDNGPNSDRFNGGMKGRKGSAHEGGVRVPLFIRWPGRIASGAKVAEIAAHIDIFPTLVELCGIPMPKTLPQDGVTLAPLIQGRAGGWPDRMIFTFRTPGGRTEKVTGSVRTRNYRAVQLRGRWQLYDMLADPGQTTDIAGRKPGVLKQLAAAFDAAVKDVCKAGFETIPIPIGYPQRPDVVMPAHEAFLEPAVGQGISYKGRAGWANDYITNWTSTDAYARWEVDVIRQGRFDFTLMYVCAKENIGAKVQLELGGRKLQARLTKAHDPDHVPSPDRVPRSEVYGKVWARLRLGSLELDKGRTQLIVRALEIPGPQAFDLKEIVVRMLD